MAQNGLFTTKVQGSNFSKVRTNREYLISQKVSDELNTYRTFDMFPMYADIYSPEYEKVGNDYVEKGAGKLEGMGVRSLFNRVGGVLVGSNKVDEAGQLRISNNVPLLDSRSNRQRIRDLSKCSVKDLVKASQEGLLGRNIYSYADFMYCKNLGKVPNNHLITLRRFPYPVDDYISTMGVDKGTRSDKDVQSKNAQSIGCMVTWLGVDGNNMSDILKYDVTMPFEMKEATWESSNVDGDKKGGPANAIAAMFDSTYREQYQNGMAGAAVNGYISKLGFGLGGDNPYTVSQFVQADNTKVYGPVDVIKKTYKRSQNGLDFNQSFTLNFDYELRSFNGINGKQAMLDLISNILAVTYSTGTFWGGGYKGSGAHQNNVFANLEIFKAHGGATSFLDAFSKDVSTVSTKIGNVIDNNGGGWKGFLQTLKMAANSIGGMLIAGFLNSAGRPDKQATNSLLSPAPIGFWHVTIGNPFHPIMSIGNMVITKTEIEHYGPLGIDDFPTGLRVKVTLDRGKTRDSRDIEKLYMHGNERIYYSWGKEALNMYKKAAPYKKDDTETGQMTAGEEIDINTMISKKEASNEEAAKKTTTDVQKLNNYQNVLMRYFGQTDEYSIYVAAAEQEYGSCKKRPQTTGSGESGRATH